MKKIYRAMRRAVAAHVAEKDGKVFVNVLTGFRYQAKPCLQTGNDQTEMFACCKSLLTEQAGNLMKG